MFDHGNDMTYTQIADVLGLKFTQVQGFLHHRGFFHDQHVFSNDDIQYIKDHASDMSFSDIAKNLGYKDHQVQCKAKKLGFRKRRYTNFDYFHDIDTPEKAYYLGYIFADGWICYNKEISNYEFGMQIQSEDDYILHGLNHIFGDQYEITKTPPHEQIIMGRLCHVGWMSCLRVYSVNLVEDLMSHGIVLNKSHHDDFPIINDNLFFDFLRGYIDGDGCFYKNPKNNYITIKIVCNSECPLNYIKERLEQYKITSHVYSPYGETSVYMLLITNQNQIKTLVNLMYHDENIPYLTRKYDKIKHLLK